MAKNITPRKENYSQWYLDVISAGKLADYAPVKGVHGDSSQRIRHLGGDAGTA